MRNIVIGVVLCLITFIGYSQNIQKEIMLLESQLNAPNAANSSNKSKIVENLSNLTFYTDYSKFKQYTDQLKVISRNNNDKESFAIACLNSYSYYSFFQKYDSAEHCLDSSLKYSRGKYDSVAVLAYLSIGNENIETQNIELAETYLDSARALLSFMNSEYLDIEYEFFSGALKVKKGLTDEGIDDIKSAIRKHINSGNLLNVTNHILTLGYIYYDLGMEDLAIIQAREALIQAKKMGDIADESLAYNLMVNSYFYSSLDSTIFYQDLYQQKALQLNYPPGLLLSYSTKALAYESYDMLEEAEIYLDSATMLKENYDLGSDQGYLNGLKGINYFKQGLYTEAIRYLNMAIEESRPVRQHDLVASYYFIKIKTLRKLNRTKAIPALFDSIQMLFSVTKNSQNLINLYQYKYNYYSAEGNYKSAIENLELYVAAKDTLYKNLSSQSTGIISEIKADNLNEENTALKESVEESQDTISRLRLFIILGVVAFLLIVVTVYLLTILRSRIRLKNLNDHLNSLAEKRATELESEIHKKDEIQRKMEATNLKYKQVTSSVQAMIWSATYDKDFNFDLDYVSEFINELAALSIEEQKANPRHWIDEVVHPEDQLMYTDFYSDLMSSDVGKSEFNYRIIDKNNKLRWLNEKVIITFRDVESGYTGLHGLVTDITAQKETEEELLRIQGEQKELIATKDKFLSIISHDLKNPFNAILGFSELLKNSYDEFTEEDHKHFIRNISDAAEGSYKLLQNLLDWSRAQGGNIQTSPTQFDLSEVILDSLSVLNPLAASKHIKINADIEYNTLVYADENMITTVIRNIVQNAIKFSFEESEIKIETRKQDNFVYLSVKDQGTGISEKDLQNLFKIDKQVKSKGTNNEPGTGLGLLLCYEFMKQNNGSIFAESDKGKGSTFTIRIPIEKTE